MNTQPYSFWVFAAALALGVVQAQAQHLLMEQKAKQATQPGKDAIAKKRHRVVKDLSGFDLIEPGKSKTQPMVVGATRGLPQPVASAPRLANLYGTDPVFAWSYAGKAEKFVFVLRDDSQEEVFRAEVVGTSYHYPATAPLLQPGKAYFWTIALSPRALLAHSVSPAGFIVLSEPARTEIERKVAQIRGGDSYAAGLARARLFTDYRLWYDALAAYTELIARYPDRPELYEERGTIYAQVDATQALAEQDFARADELSHVRKPDI